MPDKKNPLLEIVRIAEERDKDKAFDPEAEYGITEEDLLEFIAEVVAEIVHSKSAQGKGLELDDLGYLVLMGLATGIEYEKVRDER